MAGVPPDYVMPDYRMTVRFALCFGGATDGSKDDPPGKRREAFGNRGENLREIARLEGTEAESLFMWAHPDTRKFVLGRHWRFNRALDHVRPFVFAALRC
jgi:hypothetical protein